MWCTRAIAFFEPLPFEPRIKIHASGSELGRVHELHLEPFLLEDALEKDRGLHLVAGRVRCVYTEVVGEYLLGFLRDRVPVEGAWPGRLGA